MTAPNFLLPENIQTNISSYGLRLDFCCSLSACGLIPRAAAGNRAHSGLAFHTDFRSTPKRRREENCSICVCKQPRAGTNILLVYVESTDSGSINRKWEYQSRANSNENWLSFSLSPNLVSRFSLLNWERGWCQIRGSGNLHARAYFARPAIPEEKERLTCRSHWWIWKSNTG